MMMPADLLEEAQCNVNFACVDQLSPILAEGFVWSWDKSTNERVASRESAVLCVGSRFG